MHPLCSIACTKRTYKAMTHVCVCIEYAHTCKLCIVCTYIMCIVVDPSIARFVHGRCVWIHCTLLRATINYAWYISLWHNGYASLLGKHNVNIIKGNLKLVLLQVKNMFHCWIAINR